MSDEIIVCPVCSFKCVKSQLYKTGGFCPRLMWKGENHETKISKEINVDVGSPTKRLSTPEK